MLRRYSDSMPDAYMSSSSESDPYMPIASSTVMALLLSVGVSEVVVKLLDRFRSEADRAERNEVRSSSALLGGGPNELCGELLTLLAAEKGACGR